MVALHIPVAAKYTYQSHPPEWEAHLLQVRLAHGICMQVGPELELPGYGCEDHFQELDTVEHCWECIAGL